MTKNETQALEITREAIARGRGSVTASFVAARAGEADIGTRKWSAVLSSLSRKGLVVAQADGFVQRTFYTLPDQPIARASW